MCCRVAQLVCAHACIRWGLKIEFWKNTHVFSTFLSPRTGNDRQTSYCHFCSDEGLYIPAVKAYYGIVIAQLFFLTQKLVKLTFCLLWASMKPGLRKSCDVRTRTRWNSKETWDIYRLAVLTYHALLTVT